MLPGMQSEIPPNAVVFCPDQASTLPFPQAVLPQPLIPEWEVSSELIVKGSSSPTLMTFLLCPLSQTAPSQSPVLPTFCEC